MVHRFLSLYPVSVDIFIKIDINEYMFPRYSAVVGDSYKRKRVLQKVLFGAILLILVSLFPAVYFKLKDHSFNERRELKESFNSAFFDSAYNKSREMLAKDPLDFSLLTINGFSAYQLAIAQINSFNTLFYINECIWSLRKALLLKEGSSDGRIFYVLGKAYYNKGPAYADLAVKYLEKARASRYWSDDIPEYLGLAYAAIRDFRSSVAVFAEALASSQGPSDVLLLSIARSYMALDENEQARAYLIQCLDISRDSKTTAAARLLNGNILMKSGDLSGAETEYLKMLEDIGDNAEAHYQLGELYALAGDPTRARAEWRRALRIDPAHGPSRNRLNI